MSKIFSRDSWAGIILKTAASYFAICSVHLHRCYLPNSRILECEYFKIRKLQALLITLIIYQVRSIKEASSVSTGSGTFSKLEREMRTEMRRTVIRSFLPALRRAAAECGFMKP